MKLFLLIPLFIITTQWASAGIISAQNYADDSAFSTATGAVSLTGALPNTAFPGAVGGVTTVLGNATLTGGGNLFVGAGWSTLMPGGNAIAISGPEDLTIAINSGLWTAFGFYFHEPTSPGNPPPDTCSASSCTDSTFDISFYLNNVLIDSTSYSPPDDMLDFHGVILDMPFDEVRFDETTNAGENEFYGEFYVALVNVPEPGTIALVGLGLAGLGFTRRKKA